MSRHFTRSSIRVIPSLRCSWCAYARSTCAAQSNANRNDQANHLGYVSSLSLINVLDEWIEIRRWCLFTLACALVQLAGGVDAVLEGAPASPLLAAQKALILHIVPEPRTAHGGNPALAFRLANASIVDRKSDDFLRANWEDIEVKARFASVPVMVLTGAYDSDTLAAPAGILPAVYMVHGTDIYNPQAFTLFHLPLRHVGGTLKDPPDERTRAACEELVAIVKDIIHKPLVYMRADDWNQPEPDWGVYRLTGTQKKKGWECTELPADEKSWMMWERLVDEMWPGRTSGLTPCEVLTLFDYGELLVLR